MPDNQKLGKREKFAKVFSNLGYYVRVCCVAGYDS